MSQPSRPCTECGEPHKSVTGLCAEHRPKRDVKRPERPCTECGERTIAVEGVCRKCINRAAGRGEERPCGVCGIEMTSEQTCGGCVDAAKDSESTYDLDDVGEWRYNRARHTWVFVTTKQPAPAEPAPEVACIGCGLDYAPTHANQRYCERKCRDRAHMRRVANRVAA